MGSMLQKVKEMEKPSSNAWKPEKVGDCIGGEAVSGLRTVNTKFGDRVVIDIRSEEDNQIYTVWATTVIANELKKQNVQVGDQVGIKVLGLEKNYKNFIVVVEKKSRGTREDLHSDPEVPDLDDPDYPVDLEGNGQAQLLDEGK